MSDLFQEAIIVSILAATVRIATPLLFAAMGEIITQRAGIWNMGVEGTMLMGAFVAYFATTTSGSLWLGILMGVLAGGASGLIIAFMTATMRVDHFVTGLGFNLLAGGLTLFWFRSYISGRAQPTFDSFVPLDLPLLSDLPYLGEILFSQRSLTYAAFLMVPLVWFFLYRTKYGLEIRCLGENPRAVDVKGLNVTLRQYLAVIFGSMMSGLGGAFLTLGYSDRFLPEITGGRGWLAIVAIIAGNWMPTRILLAVLAFALLEAIAVHAQGVGVDIPYQFFLALPYLASILLMMALRAKTGQPAALGVPYHRE